MDKVDSNSIEAFGSSEFIVYCLSELNLVAAMSVGLSKTVNKTDLVFYMPMETKM